MGQGVVLSSPANSTISSESWIQSILEGEKEVPKWGSP